MSKAVQMDRFYAPDVKEVGLGICYVLLEAGGALSFERVAEVLGDYLQIPPEARNRPRAGHPSHTEWTYLVAWTSSDLRKKGFMARNKAGDRGMCFLTEAGHRLGHWAKLIYEGENPETPDWVIVFLRPMRIRIKRVLNNRQSQKPPDYELCRWLKYCYLMNWRQLGVGVFSLILPENIEASLWTQAQRQARVLRLRDSEFGGAAIDPAEVLSNQILDEQESSVAREPSQAVAKTHKVTKKSICIELLSREGGGHS